MRAILIIATLMASLPALAEPVRYTIVNGTEIPASLTGEPGDPDQGRRLYFDIQATGCSGCHGSPGGPGAQAAGDSSAPSLAGIGARLSEGAIRLWVVAPEALIPGTTMPAYYAAGQRTDPNDPLFGLPRLSARDVEHLVAYLVAQKTR